jgi:hypothetical protein
MPGLNKKELSERDICTKFKRPALVKAGRDVQSHTRTLGAHLLDSTLHHLLAA